MGKIEPFAPTASTRDRNNNYALLPDTYIKIRTKRYYFDAISCYGCPIFSNKLYSLSPDETGLAIWANKNIYIMMDLLNEKSLDVLTRIATGMINNLNGYTQKDEKILFHNNLISSIRWLRTELILFNLKSSPEDLPF